ncbi:hypothetical protein ACFQ0B_61410 [Nonomuraea thailandensis]
MILVQRARSLGRSLARLRPWGRAREGAAETAGARDEGRGERAERVKRAGQVVGRPFALALFQGTPIPRPPRAACG